jgi:hypothetical protein
LFCSSINQGFGISDVGLDVVMREHYSGTVPEWNAPHWTQVEKRSFRAIYM